MDQMAALLERSEAETVFGYVDAAPPPVRESLGIATARVGGGVVLSVRNDVTNYWSKALGFGFDQPVTAELVAEITGFYREEGTKVATLQFAPSVLPADWDEICKAEGLTASATIVKLARLAGLVESAETKLTIDIVRPEHADEWSSVLFRGFGMPEEGLAQMVAGLVSRPGWTIYAAWDGDQIVASASLFVRGEVAQIAGAATLPSHRAMGAQSALLATRVRDATAAGAKWLSAETGKPADGEQNPSLNNMLRLGFDIQYERSNWTWRP